MKIGGCKRTCLRFNFFGCESFNLVRENIEKIILHSIVWYEK